MVSLRCSTRRGRLRNSRTDIALVYGLYAYRSSGYRAHHWFDSARPKPRAGSATARRLSWDLTACLVGIATFRRIFELGPIHYDDTLIAFLGFEHLHFTKPVKIGDTIHATIKVLEKRESSKLDRGVMERQLQMLNQRGREVVQEGVAEFSIEAPASSVKTPASNAGDLTRILRAAI